MPFEDHQDRAPIMVGECIYCEKPFERGEDIITCVAGTVHEDCWDEFTKLHLGAKYDIAGS